MIAVEKVDVQRYVGDRIKGWHDMHADRATATEWYNNLLVNLRDEHKLTPEQIEGLDARFREFFPTPKPVSLE